jgi:hypothetical protein
MASNQTRRRENHYDDDSRGRGPYGPSPNALNTANRGGRGGKQGPASAAEGDGAGYGGRGAGRDGKSAMPGDRRDGKSTMPSGAGGGGGKGRGGGRVVSQTLYAGTAAELRRSTAGERDGGRLRLHGRLLTDVTIVGQVCAVDDSDPGIVSFRIKDETGDIAVKYALETDGAAEPDLREANTLRVFGALCLSPALAPATPSSSSSASSSSFSAAPAREVYIGAYMLRSATADEMAFHAEDAALSAKLAGAGAALNNKANSATTLAATPRQPALNPASATISAAAAPAPPAVAAAAAAKAGLEVKNDKSGKTPAAAAPDSAKGADDSKALAATEDNQQVDNAVLIALEAARDSEVGMTLAEVCGNRAPAVVRTSLDRLFKRGFIYTTIDDDHYKLV